MEFNSIVWFIFGILKKFKILKKEIYLYLVGFGIIFMYILDEYCFTVVK